MDGQWHVDILYERSYWRLACPRCGGSPVTQIVRRTRCAEDVAPAECFACGWQGEVADCQRRISQTEPAAPPNP